MTYFYKRYLMRILFQLLPMLAWTQLYSQDLTKNTEEASNRDLRRREIAEHADRIMQYYLVHSEDIDGIMSESNNTLRIGAYWLYQSQKSDAIDVDGGLGGSRARTLGMIEALSKIQLPSWWQASVLAGKGPPLNTELGYYFSSQKAHINGLNQKHVVLGNTGEYEIPEGLKLIKQSKQMVEFSYNNMVVLVNSSPFLSQSLISDTQKKCLNIAKDNNISYLFIYDTSSSTIGDNPFYCFDERGNILWKKWVYGDLQTVSSISSVTRTNKCEIIVSSDSVLVVGASSYGAFAESFHKRDGSVKFRFSTNLKISKNDCGG